jgi:hypothetical protein
MHVISTKLFMLNLFSGNMYFGSQVMQNTNDGEFFLLHNHRLSQIHHNLYEDCAIQECIKWINAPDTSVNYNAAHERMTEGTGMWLIQNPRLINWKANGGLLWLQGKGEMISDCLFIY